MPDDSGTVQNSVQALDPCVPTPRTLALPKACIFIADETSTLPATFCHDFHLFTYFLLSSKRSNTRSNHDMALSYLILSFHTSKSHHQDEETDSIGIPTKNYLFRGRSNNPLILLIRLPHPIKVQLVIGIVPTMRPSLVIRLPVQVLIDNLASRQTGDLIRETDIRKRRRSRMKDGLPRNSRRRIGQFLNQPLERLDVSLEVSDL